VEIATEKQAQDIVMLDVRAVAGFADYFVICSGTSERQINAITDDIVEILDRDERTRPFQREGEAASGWVLLDYGGVIVHVFAPPQREYYGLEELWSRAVPLVRIQ